MRRLHLGLALLATSAAAAELQLPLPPSELWLEQADPRPVPTPTSTSRYFVLKANPQIALRVLTDSTMRLDYSLPVMTQLRAGVIANEAKQGNTIKVADPVLLQVDGVAVGQFSVHAASQDSLVVFMPAEGGDRVLSLNAPRGQPLDPQLLDFVQAAKNLRKPDPSAGGVPLMGVMAALSLGTIAVLLFLMRTKADRGSPT